MTCAGGSSTPTVDDDIFPLWKYVAKIDKIGVKGGNCKFQCNFCQLVFNGSYTRVKSHLLRISGQGIRGCSTATPRDIQEMKKLVEQAEMKVRKNPVEMVPLPPPPPPPPPPPLPLRAFSESSSSSSACSSFGGSVIGLSREEGLESKKRKAATECISVEIASNLEAK